MKPILIENATAILPDKLLHHAALLIVDGRIAELGPKGSITAPAGTEVIDAKENYVSPGFIDVHVHGGGNADFMDGTPEAVRTAIQCHTRHGTTSIFPTTTTGSHAQIKRMLAACSQVQKEWKAGTQARIEGVHFYGPYFAPDKVGCHNKDGRRDPDPAEYREALKSGIVKIATCAAELKGSDEFFKAAKEAGCFVTCGHSNANWTEMKRAYDLGVRHVDHFWSAMSSVPSVRERFGFPMHGSMEQFVIRFEEMSTEVIADGVHLSPELLEYAYHTKGVKRLMLVTDSNRAVDVPPGKYRFGPIEDGEWFETDGKMARVEKSPASSIVGMDHVVRHMHQVVRVPLHDAVRMASLTPAERTGISNETGSLEKGKRADVLVLDKELKVQRVFVAGVEFTAMP